jgi:hypothetical protein
MKAPAVAKNLFDELRKRTLASKGLLPAERRASFWFKTYATDLASWQRKHRNVDYSDLQREKFSKQLVSANGAFPGAFYFFLYDAKWKDELPYWDQFPFILVLQRDEKSFLGLNFHYLDYATRAKFFDVLYPYREGRTATPDVRDLRMRIKITYDILQSSARFRAFKPCIKRYLTEHVQTPLMKVSAHEWDIALFLPVESFVGESRQTVWKLSQSKYKL